MEKRLKKFFNLPSYLVRKLFYAHLFSHDVNYVMKGLVYSPYECFRIASELLVGTKFHENQNLSKNSLTDEDILLIAKEIKAQYTPAKIKLLKYFLQTLAYISLKHGVKLEELPPYLGDKPAHLFIREYLPLIDKLLILVSSREEVSKDSSANSAKKAKKGDKNLLHVQDFKGGGT